MGRPAVLVITRSLLLVRAGDVVLGDALRVIRVLRLLTCVYLSRRAVGIEGGAGRVRRMAWSLGGAGAATALIRLPGAMRGDCLGGNRRPGSGRRPGYRRDPRGRSHSHRGPDHRRTGGRRHRKARRREQGRHHSQHSQGFVRFHCTLLGYGAIWQECVARRHPEGLPASALHPVSGKGTSGRFSASTAGRSRDRSRCTYCLPAQTDPLQRAAE